MTDAAATRRLLIFVVGYRGQSSLQRLLERIPAAIFAQYESEMLVVDTSPDRSGRPAHPGMVVTVLPSGLDRGYGGNQKVAYAYAIAEGFDYVAMLHADGQYAPEDLPRLLAPLRDGEADAVLGSRMAERGAAIRGGMPIYKYVGNRILTVLQNVLLRTRFSELHSGYRAYAVESLRSIPFRLDTDEFHFDTEIVIQLLNAGARIAEVPIRTYSGGELSHIKGLSYAKNVVLATLRNVAHRAGLLYQRRYDPCVAQNWYYDLKLGYPSSHSWAIERVPPGATVLDLGAGPAGVARELVGKGCAATVVDRFPPAERDPRIEVLVQDLDQPLRFDVRPYRYLLLLDIIEHLKDPELFLERLRSQFDHDTKTVILTTPNVAFIVQRLMLLLGQFNYGRVGTLDRTHTRLFTLRGLRHLLRDAGFRITRLRGVPAPFPKALGDGRLARFLLALNLALIRVSKTLFSYQFYVEAESTPDVEFLLREVKDDANRSGARAGCRA